MSRRRNFFIARGGNSFQAGQQGYAGGGALFNLNGTLTLTNVTIAGNTVAAGFLLPPDADAFVAAAEDADVPGPGGTEGAVSAG